MPKKHPPGGWLNYATGQNQPHKRARKVISPSGGIMRPKLPIRKTGRLVHCEGCLVLDVTINFESFPKIARYLEQKTAGLFVGQMGETYAN